jgi:hypothetical protein
MSTENLELVNVLYKNNLFLVVYVKIKILYILTKRVSTGVVRAIAASRNRVGCGSGSGSSTHSHNTSRNVVLRQLCMFKSSYFVKFIVMITSS